MSILEEINYFYYKMALHELQVMNDGAEYGGLSYNSMLYLNVIGQMEDCTVSSLSEALRVTKPAVTAKVNELVRAGAVERVRSETDRRVFYVRLSGKMRESTRLYDEVFGKIEQKLRQKYTESELAVFQKVLHEISGCEWSKIKHE